MHPARARRQTTHLQFVVRQRDLCICGIGKFCGHVVRVRWELESKRRGREPAQWTDDSATVGHRPAADLMRMRSRVCTPGPCDRRAWSRRLLPPPCLFSSNLLSISNHERSTAKMAKLATKTGQEDLPHPMENVKPDNWQDKFEVRCERTLLAGIETNRSQSVGSGQVKVC